MTSLNKENEGKDSQADYYQYLPSSVAADDRFFAKLGMNCRFGEQIPFYIRQTAKTIHSSES
jgi:hypothetical protein